MYLSTYAFTGDTTDLLAKYDRLLEQFRGEMLINVAVATSTGMLVVDTCPDRATAEAFVASPEWKAALSSVGLPEPEVIGVGDVHAAISTVSVPA